MKQYLDLLRAIKENGTQKPGAREGMPGSLSLFGYQFRHDLMQGFPLLTTKKVFWKGVVHELIWFLKGDTNIKYLIDNGVNIWNEDAYNYYLKLCSAQGILRRMEFEEFISTIKELDSDISSNKTDTLNDWEIPKDYVLGHCGFQYGRVWRNWEANEVVWKGSSGDMDCFEGSVDQIWRLIQSLKNTPESRRHIVTAIDPAHDKDLALYWCHAMFQFNCRPIPVVIDDLMSPKYYLDCQLYQRSADVVLGVPFNIASYALLVHIIAKLCNMIPGEFIHTFGDVHIYDNHLDAVEEQLNREPTELPKLHWNTEAAFENQPSLDNFLDGFEFEDLFLEGYNPQSAIKAKLSTGLQ